MTGTVDPPPGLLAGIRILSVEQYGAGPLGTMYLADLGAEIVKIEDPTAGGDVSRYIPPGRTGTDSLFFEAFNRGKKSVVIDLKSPAGRRAFERLVESADGVFSNLRAGEAERLGLTYAALAPINPAIVSVTLTGYGRSESSAPLPGYDALIQAEAGWASLTGGPDDPPTKSGLSLADYVAGLTAALGLVAALFDARQTGRGRQVDTNLYDAALAMLTYPATWYLSRGLGTDRLPWSAHPSVVPFQFFPTADGYLAVACPKEKFFATLVALLGLPQLAVDPRFASFETRRTNRDELLAVLSGCFRERETATWLALLRGRVPVAPVRSLPEALDADELTDRCMLAVYDHPTLGRVRSIGLPLAVDGHRPAYRPGPLLGSDTEAILASAGFDPAAVERLRADGAFGSQPSDPVDAGGPA